MTRFRADCLLLLAAAIWGTAFYFQKSAMAHIGPLLFLGIRGLIAAFALAPLAWMERKKNGGDCGLVKIGMAGGAAFFAAGFMQQYGIVDATVTNAGLLTALYVIVTPLLLWAVTRRRPSLLVVAGIALAFGGTWMLHGGSANGFGPADWIIACSTLLWASHIVITDAAARRDRPFAFTAIQFATVALLALPMAMLFEDVSWAAIWAARDSLLFVGLLSSALTFSLLAIALRHVPAMEATILMSTETLFALLAGYVLLDERMRPIGWLGAAAILAAVAIVQLGRVHRSRTDRQPATIT